MLALAAGAMANPADLIDSVDPANPADPADPAACFEQVLNRLKPIEVPEPVRKLLKSAKSRGYTFEISTGWSNPKDKKGRIEAPEGGYPEETCTAFIFQVTDAFHQQLNDEDVCPMVVLEKGGIKALAAEDPEVKEILKAVEACIIFASA